MLVAPYTSSNSTPDLAATKLRVMKLILLLGLTKIDAWNWLASTTACGLFVSSQITWKSTIPRLPCTALKKGSTVALKFALVNASLNSKSWNLAAVYIAFSNMMNNLRTLILSNALGLLRRVLSPNRTVPSPGNVTIGLTLFL